MRQLDQTVAQRLLDQLHAEMVQRLQSYQERHLSEGTTFCDDMLDYEHQEMDAEIDRLSVALRNNNFSSVSSEVMKTLSAQNVRFDEDSRVNRHRKLTHYRRRILTHPERGYSVNLCA